MCPHADARPGNGVIHQLHAKALTCLPACCCRARPGGVRPPAGSSPRGARPASSLQEGLGEGGSKAPQEAGVGAGRAARVGRRGAGCLHAGPFRGQGYASPGPVALSCRCLRGAPCALMMHRQSLAANQGTGCVPQACMDRSTACLAGARGQGLPPSFAYMPTPVPSRRSPADTPCFLCNRPRSVFQ